MKKTEVCKSCGKPLYETEIRKRYNYHEKCFTKAITRITKNSETIYSKPNK